MKIVATLPLSLLALVCAAALPAQAKPSEVKPTELDAGACVALARVGMVDAIATALKAVKGRAVKVELEGKQAGAVRAVGFEVMVITGKDELHEVIVDAVSGAVTESIAETDPADLSEVPGYLRALRGSKRSLASLVKRATRGVEGVPIEATLTAGEEGSVCAVTILNEGHKRVVALGADATIATDKDRDAKQGEKAKSKKGEGSEEGEESEGGEHGGKGERAEKKEKKEKKAKGKKGERGEEEEENEGGEHGGKGERAEKKEEKGKGGKKGEERRVA